MTNKMKILIANQQVFPGACRRLHNQLATALLKILEFFSIFNFEPLRSSLP